MKVSGGASRVIVKRQKHEKWEALGKERERERRDSGGNVREVREKGGDGVGIKLTKEKVILMNVLFFLL